MGGGRGDYRRPPREFPDCEELLFAKLHGGLQFLASLPNLLCVQHQLGFCDEASLVVLGRLDDLLVLPRPRFEVFRDREGWRLLLLLLPRLLIALISLCGAG